MSTTPISDDAIEAAAKFWEFLGQSGSAQTIRERKGFRTTAEVFAAFEEVIRQKVKAEMNQPNILIEQGPEGPIQVECHRQFVIELSETGKYFAVGSPSPSFVVSGNSAAEAADAAQRLMGLMDFHEGGGA